MGIPADERGHLFGRFTRLESAKASQIRGTGLGLYICRQIVRAMGGDVWLQASVPGHGSVFAFTLPEGMIPSGDTAPLPAISGQSAQSSAAPPMNAPSYITAATAAAAHGASVCRL